MRDFKEALSQGTGLIDNEAYHRYVYRSINGRLQPHDEKY